MTHLNHSIQQRMKDWLAVKWLVFASLRVLCLTDWGPGSRDNNHRAGAHSAAGPVGTVDGEDPEFPAEDGRLLLTLNNQQERLIRWRWTVSVKGGATAPPRGPAD